MQPLTDDQLASTMPPPPPDRPATCAVQSEMSDIDADRAMAAARRASEVREIDGME